MQPIQQPGTEAMYTQLGIAEAVRHADRLYISGQVGWDESLQPAPGFAAQARLALENLQRVLEAGGSSTAQLLEIKAFIVTDGKDGDLMDRVGELFAIKRQLFPDNVCAATAVGVTCLVNPALMLELAAVAAVGQDNTQG